MEDFVLGVFDTGKTCDKCGGEMKRAGEIIIRGKAKKVWRCIKCQHRMKE